MLKNDIGTSPNLRFSEHVGHRRGKEMFSGQGSFCCISGKIHGMPMIKENTQNACLTDTAALEMP